jgi:hypothetical protein
LLLKFVRWKVIERESGCRDRGTCLLPLNGKLGKRQKSLIFLIGLFVTTDDEYTALEKK